MSTVNVTVKVEKEMGEVETRVMKFYAHATIAEAENRIRTLCCLIGGGLKDANDVIPLENVTIGDLFGPVVFDGGKSVVTLGVDIKAYDAGFVRGVAMMNKRQKCDTDKTPAGYAAGVKQSLGSLCVMVSVGHGRSFLTEAESQAAYESLMANNHERHLIAYMTPIFIERWLSIFPEDFVLVNSEEYCWVPQSADLKVNYTAPDNFIAPHYLVNFRSPYNNAPSIGEYGEFPVFAARRSLAAVSDAKKKLDNKGEGEFMKFLEAVSYSSSSGEIFVARGFVYDWQSCSLMTAVNGSITQVTTVKWVTPGSYDLVRDYFRGYESEWHFGLQAACTGLEVSVPRFSTLNNNLGRCVLGEGAFGRVFLVLRDGQRLAMKLVLGKTCCDELYSEFQLIQGLPAEAQSCVVGVEASSLWRSQTSHIAAFLMPAVGIPFFHPSEVVDEYGPLILESLSDLHDASVCHGDARYKNVVRLEIHAGPPRQVEFRWIDLRLCGRPSVQNFKKDVIAFFKSIDHAYSQDAVEQYANNAASRTWSSLQRRQAARMLWN